MKMVTIALSIALHYLQPNTCKPITIDKRLTNIYLVYCYFIECILQGAIQLVQCHVPIVSFLIQAFLFDFSWVKYRLQH